MIVNIYENFLTNSKKHAIFFMFLLNILAKEKNFMNIQSNMTRQTVLTPNTFVQASDEDLYNLAERQVKKKGSFASFAVSCAAVDAVSNGILKSHVKVNKNGVESVIKAPLSAKIGAGMNSLKSWGVGFLAAGALVGLKYKLCEKSDKVQNFEQNHPIISLCADVAVLALGYKACKGASKKANLGKKLEKVSKPVQDKISKLSAKLDSSKIATKITNACGSFSNSVNKKFPALAQTGRILLANSVLLMLMGGTLKLTKQNREIQENYMALKDIQTQLKESLMQ